MLRINDIACAKALGNCMTYGKPAVTLALAVPVVLRGPIRAWLLGFLRLVVLPFWAFVFIENDNPGSGQTGLQVKESPSRRGFPGRSSTVSAGC